MAASPARSTPRSRSARPPGLASNAVTSTPTTSPRATRQHVAQPVVAEPARAPRIARGTPTGRARPGPGARRPRPRSAVDLRQPRAPAVARTRSRVEVPTPHISRARAPGRLEARVPQPDGAPRHMPPRNPLGVVSGVLESPCASNHSDAHVRAPGARRPRTSSGRSCNPSDVSTGNARRVQRRPRTHRPLEQARASPQVRRPVRDPRLAGSPTSRASGSSASASASAPRDAPAVRSEVRQRSAVTLSGRPTRARASRRTRARPPGCPRSRARASGGVQEVERLGQRHVHLAEHRVLAQPHDHRRLLRQRARPLGHGRVELAVRHHLVDDPDARRLGTRRSARRAAAARWSSCARRCGR